MESIIKFTPLLFSVALAYMYIILGTSFTNAQTSSAQEVGNATSTANLTSADNLTRVLNVTNYKNVNSSQENRTERLDILLFDENSTQPRDVTELRNGTTVSLSVNTTTGNGTSADQNVTTWSTNQNQSTGSTPTAAFEVYVNDTTLIIDVPGASDSGNRTNITLSGINASILQNTTRPPNSTDGTFTGFYTYKPIHANGSEVELLENQTSSVGVTFLSRNSTEDDLQAQNRTPKVDSKTTFPPTNRTSLPSITITSYADAFNNISSENQTLESNILIIPLNGSIPTLGPSTTLQIDSSLNVTETTTTMSTTLQADGTTSESMRPDATKGRSWSSTLKNKLTTPIFPANHTTTDNGTTLKTAPPSIPSRTEYYTVNDSEKHTTVPTTSVTLLFIPYAYGNESTTMTTEYTTPAATTRIPTTLTTATTTSPTMLTTTTASPTTLTSIRTTTTERNMVTTTEKTTVPLTGMKNFNGSEEDKVKKKPSKKKTYEELLPEEKENIVTVVFNKLNGNLTDNFEDAFSYFVSRIMNNYLKMWSTLKEPENELSSGPEQAEVTEQNIHFLKPTPYFSKDSVVIMATFYVTNTSPSGTLTVFPGEVVVQNLKEARYQIQKELKLNATDIFLGVHPNFDAVRPSEERQLFSHFEPLFIALIAVAATCLFTVLTAIICFKCRQRAVEYSDREKLNQERTYSLRGQDLRPECEILREERQMAEKDGGMMNGEKKHPVRQNGEEGWVVPIGDMPLEEQNAPAIQDTRL